MGRSPCCSKDEGLNRGAWTAHEDQLLTRYIDSHGVGKWRNLPKKAGLNRCGKSCRLRWLNYLRPDIKRGNISPDEEDLIIRLHKLLGNRMVSHSREAAWADGQRDQKLLEYQFGEKGRPANPSPPLHHHHRRRRRFPCFGSSQQTISQAPAEARSPTRNCHGPGPGQACKVLEEARFLSTAAGGRGKQ
ncbi:unnamed protein product [Linum tenue]|uniref:Uncharacterized protein n=1 Tax=Linum tenue TaxID=586396 RepID=A0AAV0HRX5_9ROSI|nr:unnamed protein product [Linum tenue]